EGAEQRRLSVGDDVDASCEPMQLTSESSPLGGCPEPSRGHDERGDATSAPPAPTPHRAQDGRELLQIAIGGNDRRRDAMLGPDGDADPRSADVRADAHRPSFGGVSFRGSGCTPVHYEAARMIPGPSN